MQHLVRNFLIAQGALYVVTQFAMVWLGIRLDALLGVFPFPAWHLAWQWLTHPLVEIAGGNSLLPFAITLYFEWLIFPRVVAVYGARMWALAMVSASVVAGLLATAVALVAPEMMPVVGASELVVGVLAFEAWARRNAGPMHMSLFGQGPTFEVTGKMILGALVAFAAISLVVNPFVVGFASSIGAILGGVLAAWGREQRSAKRSTKHAFDVIRGGRASRDRFIH